MALQPGHPLTRALLIAAVLALGRGELDDADTLLTRVLAVDDDQRRTAIATAFLGHLERARGHHDQAVGHHARAADLFSELGNTPGVAWSRYDLALLARQRGDSDGAAGHLRESLSGFREMGDAHAIACATWALLTVELRRDRVDGAERLLAAAHGCCGAAPGESRRRALPGRLVGDGLWPAGAAGGRPAPRPGPHTGDSAEIVGHSSGRAEARRRATTGGSLTVREQQVARLVAGGSTNRQIGQALGIAEKTTEAHVHNIIHKLGAHNRAEVAARVSAHERSG